MNYAKQIATTYGLYSGIRMIIGIYHTLYLLSTGVTLQQYSKLQFIFTLTIILSEIPIARFSDQYSRKNSVLIGVLLTVIYYLCCLNSPDIIYLSVASVTYGLALSFVGGAAEGWLINTLNNNQEYAYYNSWIVKVTSIGSLICGISGYFLYKFTGDYKILYTVSYLLMIVILILFFKTPEEKLNRNKIKDEINIKRLLHRIAETKYIIYYFILAGVFTVLMQIVFYYWQPIMSFNETHRDEVLLCCFLGVFLSQFILSKTVLSIKNMNFYKIIKLSCVAAIIGFSLLYGVKTFAIGFIGILPYIITFGVLSIIPVILQNRFVATNPQLNDISSSVMSVFSVFSRILALVLFGILSLISSEIKIINLIFIPIICLVIYVLINLTWQKKYGDFYFKDNL